MSAAEKVVASYRQDTRDTVTPYLWSDEEVYEYLGEAYREFVRSIGGVPDFASDELKVPVSTGERFVDIHPSVLRVVTAFRVSDNAEVRVVNMEDLVAGSPLGEDYGLTTTRAMSNESGSVTHLVLGVGVNKGMLVSTPEADDELQLSVYRMPLEQEVTDKHELSEVPLEHRRALVLWMKHLGYNKQDADTYNPKASEEAGARFMSYCRSVKAELERKKAKVRVVAYGGI